MKKSLYIICFVLATSLLTADDFQDLLGFSLAQAIGRLGYPDTMAVSRGKEAWMDDVVFIYPDGLTVYWFKDRIWSLGLADSTAHTMFGIKKGMTKKEIVDKKIGPAFEENGLLYIDLPDQGWPSRLKIGFTGGKVSTIFLYRSDF